MYEYLRKDIVLDTISEAITNGTNIYKSVKHLSPEQREWKYNLNAAKFGYPYSCPICNNFYVQPYNFCPSCGTQLTLPHETVCDKRKV